MKHYYQLILTLAVVLTVSLSQVKASHISGGDITYQCVGQDSFLVTLNLFRDCVGIQAPPSAPVNFTSSCGGNITATLFKTSSFEISQLCPTQIVNSTCNGGSLVGQEQHIYQGIVVLSTPCNNWTMVWTTCCRNTQVANLGNTSLYIYLQSTMYSGVDSCNTSPSFGTLPLPYVCINQPANFNFGVIEPDGDSLVYFMSPSLTSATAIVTYSGSFTYLQPLPGANLVLNQSNGQMNFTATAVGVYIVTVRVEEYDRGVGALKGTYIREMQVYVSNCSNISPVLDSPGITNYTGNGSRIDSNTISICQGDNFSFDLIFSDSNTLDTLSIQHNIFQALDSTAIITTTNTNPLTVNISWTVPGGVARDIPISIIISDGACPVMGSGIYTTNIHIIESTVASEDLTICSSSWTDLGVNGGSTFVWTVISGSPIDTVQSSSTYNMSCLICDNPSVSPQVTTMYQVVSNNTSCSNIDTVIVTVVPDFSISVTPDTLACTSDSFQLWVNALPISNQYTYQWNPSARLSNDTISNPMVEPYGSIVYGVQVQSALGCLKTAHVTLGLNSTFPSSIQIWGANELCVGDSTVLEVELGGIQISGCGLSNVICSSGQDSLIVGSGTQTNTNTSYPAPYGNWYWGAKHQILYTAAELNAMGFTGGQISSISFDIMQVGTVNYNNYEIKMGCTSINDLSSGWVTGLVTVLPGYTHVPTLGWNEHVFATPYSWDGVSNLVVEVCFHNASYASAGSSLSYYSPTSFTSVRYYRADISSVCSSVASTGTSSNRPNIKFNYCSSVSNAGFSFNWSPSGVMDSSNIVNPLVYPSVTTSFSVIVTDTNGVCSDTIDHLLAVVTEYNAGFTSNSPYCVSDTVDNLVPLFPGGIFTGAGTNSTGEFDPNIAGIGTWPINYNTNSGNLCNNDSIMLVQVIPLPDASINIVEVCAGGLPVTLTANTGGGIWSGNGITDSLLGVFDPTGMISGDYIITYQVTTSCTNYDTAIIKIVEPYTFTLNSSVIDVCEGQSLDLSTNYTLSNNPLQGNGPIKETWTDANGFVDTNGVFDASVAGVGTYPVTLEITGMDGTCGSSQIITVFVRAIEFASPTNALSYCESQTSAKIFVNPWLFGMGVSYTQTPLGSLGVNDTLIITPFGQNGKFDATVKGKGDWEMEFTYVNAYGCVGVLLDTLHVLPEASNAVTNNGNTITATATGGYTYQWLDCNNGNTRIAGATSQSYTPSYAGKFAVEIAAGSCKVTSACEETWPLSVSNIVADLGVSIYPNPVQNELRIDKGNNDELTIEITDNTGKVVFQKVSTSQITVVEMGKLASGIYIVKMSNANGTKIEKVVKK